MDIIGYVFIGVAVLSAISGLVKGFAKTLIGLVSSIGSMVISAVLTPMVSNLPFVQNLIEDTPVVIGDSQFYFLRTLIVFATLSILFFVICLVIKGFFKFIFDRVKVLKIIDRILGFALNVAVVWAVFGVLFALSNIGTEWLTAIDEQLASSGINVGLAQLVGNVTQLFSQSAILSSIYSAFNPIGDLITSLLI